MLVIGVRRDSFYNTYGMEAKLLLTEIGSKCTGNSEKPGPSLEKNHHLIKSILPLLIL